MYTLGAVHPGLGSVRADSRLPRLETALVSIEPTNAALPYDNRLRVRFSVKDLPGKSYYKLMLYQVVPLCRSRFGSNRIYDDPAGVLGYKVLTLESRDPSFYYDAAELDEPVDAINVVGSLFFAPVFSDLLFENATREFEIVFEPTTFETEIEPRFMLVVSGLSEKLVRYDRTFILQDEYLFVPDPIFTNPIDVYSNVEGGLGIFAGYTNNTYRFDPDGNAWEEGGVGIGSHPLPACGD